MKRCHGSGHWTGDPFENTLYLGTNVFEVEYGCGRNANNGNKDFHSLDIPVSVDM